MATLSRSAFRSAAAAPRLQAPACRFSRPERAPLVCRAAQHDTPTLDRRQTLLGLAAAAVAASAAPLPACATEFATFYGLASPPTSYGGYGGNAKEDAKYTFEYPENWKSEAPNKIEKGSQGIDCRVYNPRNKQQQAFVVTFGRAGEDNKAFRLADIDTTLAGFAGADYDMQDALSYGEKKSGQRDENGQVYYDVQVDSPDVTYLASITVSEGKVFGMFVKSPTKLFESDKEALRHMVASFHTI